MNRTIVAAIIGIIVIVLVISFNYMAPTEAPPQPVVAEKPKQQEPSSPQLKELAPPSFDVVRVNPNGDAVMAGRAEPGSAVNIIDSGANMGRIKTDSRGEWVFVPEKPLKPGRHRLSLSMKVEDSAPVDSTSNVVLVVPERNQDIAGRPGGGQTLALKIAPDGTATVMQNPGGGSGGKLTVDAVDYDEQGRLFISGRAEPEATVQLYLNNRFIGHARAGIDDGTGGSTWTMRPDNPVAPGLYKLRADHVDNSGKVLARVEFPFLRAAPITDPALKRGDYVIVQPGNSLWRLARRTYGEGTRYTIIYQANTDQIQDPDLIYPGQRFKLPE